MTNTGLLTGEKQIEIYVLDYEKDVPKYYLFCTVTESNKNDLRMVHFPNIKIAFDELFSGIDYETGNEG